eukprot:PhF_6_TR20545/c0_g1_i1/m.29669
MYDDESRDSMLCLVAAAHHRNVVLSKHWKTWKHFKHHSMHVVTPHELALAREHHNRLLKTVFLRMTLDAYHRSLYKRFCHTIADAFFLNRTLRAWRHVTTQLRACRQKENTFRKATKPKMVIQNTFQKWLGKTKLRICRQQSLRETEINVREQLRHRCLSNVFRQWYVQATRVNGFRRNLYAFWERWRHIRIRKSFRKLRQYCEHRKEKKLWNCLAQNIRRKRMASIIFRLWFDAWKCKIMMESVKEAASVHYSRKLMKKALKRFRENAACVREDRKSQQDALERRRKRLLSIGVAAWMDAAHNIMRQKQLKSLEHVQRRATREHMVAVKVVRQWRHFVHSRRKVKGVSSRGINNNSTNLPSSSGLKQRPSPRTLSPVIPSNAMATGLRLDPCDSALHLPQPPVITQNTYTTTYKPIGAEKERIQKVFHDFQMIKIQFEKSQGRKRQILEWLQSPSLSMDRREALLAEHDALCQLEMRYCEGRREVELCQQQLISLQKGSSKVPSASFPPLSQLHV